MHIIPYFMYKRKCNLTGTVKKFPGEEKGYRKKNVKARRVCDGGLCGKNNYHYIIRYREIFLLVSFN